MILHASCRPVRGHCKSVLLLIHNNINYEYIFIGLHRFGLLVPSSGMNAQEIHSDIHACGESCYTIVISCGCYSRMWLD